jgi:hypothetical protein
MKKLLIGIFVLGLTNLAYSQSSNGEVAEVKLSNVVVTPLNIDYLKKVHDKTAPAPVIALESKVARYDIRTSPVFDGNFEAYEVVFSKSKGSIIATYDSNGKIVSTYERYKDLTLPPPIRNSIYKEHPGWAIQSDAYLVSYYDNRGVKKLYKAQIRKDNLTKNLKIDVEGKILN